MNYYFAEFYKVQNTLLRKETRVYIKDQPEGFIPSVNEECLGVVFAKNPGSAQPSKNQNNQEILNTLAPLDIGKDRMLKNIRAWAKDALSNNLALYNNPYIRVINLFQVVDPKLSSAISTFNKLSKSNQKIAKVEVIPTPIKFVWYAWGADTRLLGLREFHLDNNNFTCPKFYVQYNEKKQQVCLSQPGQNDKVKHIQGMEKTQVVDYLKKIL